MAKRKRRATVKRMRRVRMRDTIGMVTPTRVGSKITPAVSHREIGSAVIATGPVGAVDYARLENLLCSSNTLGTRCALLSRMYEVYSVNSLRYELILNGPATATATVVQAFDTDVGDASPAATLLGVREMSEWRMSQVVSFPGMASGTMLVQIRQPTARGYYTSYDPHGDYRFSYCGQYYLYAMAVVTGVTYTVRVYYDLTFYEPQVENPGVAMFGGMTSAVAPTAGEAWDDPVYGVSWRSASAGHSQVSYQPYGMHIDGPLKLVISNNVSGTWTTPGYWYGGNVVLTSYHGPGSGTPTVTNYAPGAVISATQCMDTITSVITVPTAVHAVLSVIQAFAAGTAFATGHNYVTMAFSNTW